MLPQINQLYSETHLSHHDPNLAQILSQTVPQQETQMWAICINQLVLLFLKTGKDSLTLNIFSNNFLTIIL